MFFLDLELRKLKVTDDLRQYFTSITSGNQLNLTALGSLLETIANEGAYDAFYSGEIAEEIVQKVCMLT